jgi:hypothetical protein
MHREAVRSLVMSRQLLEAITLVGRTPMALRRLRGHEHNPYKGVFSLPPRSSEMVTMQERRAARREAQYRDIQLVYRAGSARVVDCGYKRNIPSQGKPASIEEIHTAVIGHQPLVVAKCPNRRTSRPETTALTVNTMPQTSEDCCRRRRHEAHAFPPEGKSLAYFICLYAYRAAHAVARVCMYKRLFDCVFVSYCSGCGWRGSRRRFPSDLASRQAARHFEINLCAHRGAMSESPDQSAPR